MEPPGRRTKLDFIAGSKALKVSHYHMEKALSISMMCGYAELLELLLTKPNQLIDSGSLGMSMNWLTN